MWKGKKQGWNLIIAEFNSVGIISSTNQGTATSSSTK